jgi:hypothetical protein
VPVWHEKTKALRESGELVVIGITQEQHPDRCRLYAQWQEFDWPILWDPFNLSGASVVPLLTAVDEYGVIRGTRLHPDRFGEQFMERDFEDPGAAPDVLPRVHRGLLDEGVDADAGDIALARLLFEGVEDIDESIHALEGCAAEGAPAATQFRLGVGYRLRYDSDSTRPEDFQASLDAWARALAEDPNQYIWRRRIQQYGPRLDKPYPFYDWVTQATEEVTERGETAFPVLVSLTEAEIADPKRKPVPWHEHEEPPDPEHRITRDVAGLVTIESAAAAHTGSTPLGQAPPVRVHVALRPDAKRDVHWSNDAGPAVVWVTVPKGWEIIHNLYSLTAGEGAAESTSELRRLDFEVVPPLGHEGTGRVRGYALYFVCEGASGECVYRRSDFSVEITSTAQ